MLIVGGIDPVSWLLLKYRCNKLVALSKFDGIFPVRWLDSKFNSCSFGSVIRTVGMVPVSTFLPRRNEVREIIFPSTEGMGPVRPDLDVDKYFRFVKHDKSLVAEFGKLPLDPLGLLIAIDVI